MDQMDSELQTLHETQCHSNEKTRRIAIDDKDTILTLEIHPKHYTSLPTQIKFLGDGAACKKFRKLWQMHHHKW